MGRFFMCGLLSTVTRYITYPILQTDTCVGFLNSALWFSTLDLISGYHNNSYSIEGSR